MGSPGERVTGTEQLVYQVLSADLAVAGCLIPRCPAPEGTGDVDTVGTGCTWL